MEKKKPGQFRIGKTSRDHKSGAWLRCQKNKQARAEYQNDSKMSFRDIAHTCNGKRNRFSSSSAI